MTSIQSPQTSALTGLRYAPTPKGPCGIREIRIAAQASGQPFWNGTEISGALRNVESRKIPEAAFPACSRLPASVLGSGR